MQNHNKVERENIIYWYYVADDIFPNSEQKGRLEQELTYLINHLRSEDAIQIIQKPRKLPYYYALLRLRISRIYYKLDFKQVCSTSIKIPVLCVV